MIEVELSPGACGGAVERRLRDWASEDAVARLWRRDTTLWSPDADAPELADRLGWLELPETSRSAMAPLDELRTSVPFWFTDLVLLGMGGSSLAPEVIYRTMPGEGLPLTLVDTTHPAAIRDLEWLRPANSIFVVASKSGTTVETLSLFRHFWSATAEVAGEPGAHFIAITDPGSPLAELAHARGFRAVIEAPPDVGGRFSALGPFGLVPAALAGADITALLDDAVLAADACKDDVRHNPGFLLGAVLGELALAGRDKATFIANPDWDAFPGWAEQLIAESTGKAGRGIVPVTYEPPREPAAYGDDRLFVGLVLGGGAAREAEQWGEADETPGRLDALEAAGHPVVRIRLERPEELGALFFVWQVGVAMAGSVLGIHPFNQPDVQLAKRLARRAMGGDAADPDEAPHPDEAVDLLWEHPRFGHAPARNPVPPDVDGIRARVHGFLDRVKATDYVAIQAYLRGGDDDDELLAALREALARVTGAATTLGYGPRFLHSTGQLHKGGADNGACIQLVDDAGAHVHVPESDFTFRQLIRAQALGDLAALARRGRRALRVRVGGPEGLGLRRLIQLVNERG